MAAKKYFLKTYGCQMNISDSERIAAKLEELGFRSAENDQEADLIVFNTCSVRQSAEDRVWGAVNNYRKKNLYPKKKTIILTGCMAKRPEVVKKMDKVDIFMDIKDLGRLPVLLKKNGLTNGKKEKDYSDYFFIKPKYASSFTAYVPIMTGCNNFCSYCIVPYVRGREVSRPFEEVVSEVKELVDSGYKEIWLLGQNVNSYNHTNLTRIKREYPANKNTNTQDGFVELLREINKIPGKFWVRFVSSHPKDMSDELLKVLTEGNHLTDYVHLALQSGDDEVLKKMNRHYTSKNYLGLVKKIRKALPEVFLATDIIVGFPGETKKQFLNTVKVFKQARFDMAYINQYSPRAGAVSAKMEDSVPKSEKKLRDQELNKILSLIAKENNEKFVGRTVEVLIDGRARDGRLIGKDRGYRSVKVGSDKNLVGQFVKVKITKAFDYGLEGVLVNSH